MSDQQPQGPPPDHDRPIEGADYTVEPPDTEVKVESGSIAITPTALHTIDRAQIDSQIATAKQYPRHVTKALSKARSMATLTKEVAETMLYGVRRGGKLIEGPSVRLAEVIASTWTNLRIDAQVIDEGATTLTAMATCFDLENNVAIRVQVKRRITDKNGRRYNDDMIVTTGNAAISIGLRNAVFRVIPRALVEEVYQAARTASLGKGKTLKELREESFNWFGARGVKPEQLFGLLNVTGMDDVMEDQIVTLRGIVATIKRGEQTVEDLFKPDVEPSQATNNLNEALKQKAGRTEGGEKPGAVAGAPAAEGTSRTDVARGGADKAKAQSDLDSLEGGRRK